MPKDRQDFYTKLPRQIFKEDCFLSWKAKWLFTVLCELEHRFTGKKVDFFFRSQADLSKDTGMTINSNRKYRKELEDGDWIETWKMHWVDRETGKKSEKHTIAFRLLL